MSMQFIEHRRGSADTYSWVPPFDWSIGYKYDLSKRTSLYASYAHISNDASADAFVTGNSSNNLVVAPAAKGQSANGMDVGMIYKF